MVILMRIIKLQEAMQKEGISAALIIHHRDLLYYANTAQPCNLLIPDREEPVLFVRRAMEMVRKETHLEKVQSSAGLKPIRDLLNKLYPDGGKIGLEEDVLPASLYKRICREFAGFDPVDISPLIMRQRAVKEPAEQQQLRKTAAIFDEAHRTIMENLAPGITEIELAAEVYRRVRRSGADFVNFHRRWDNTSTHEGLIAGSATSWKIAGLAMTVTGIGTGPAMPWGASPAKIRAGDLLVMDIGINYRGYHVDIARSYVAGRADSLQQERFAQVNLLMEAVVEAALPGISAGDLFSVAEAKAEELGVREYFQGWGDMQGHYIGHGIGLELDEIPALTRGNPELLAAGMVVCLEPKLIVPEWGAVDIEDTVIIHPDGPEVLTPVPLRLFEVD